MECSAWVWLYIRVNPRRNHSIIPILDCCLGESHSILMKWNATDNWIAVVEMWKMPRFVLQISSLDSSLFFCPSSSPIVGLRCRLILLILDMFVVYFIFSHWACKIQRMQLYTCTVDNRPATDANGTDADTQCLCIFESIVMKCISHNPFIKWDFPF